MWTTVFSDDGDIAASEFDEHTPHAAAYEQSDRSPATWIAEVDDAPAARSPEQTIAVELPDRSARTHDRYELFGCSTSGDSFDVVQMDEILSPTVASDASAALDGRARGAAAVVERVEQSEDRAQAYEEFGLPPAITVTEHADAAATTSPIVATTRGDEHDDSDADTPPSSEDEDYPASFSIVLQ